MSIINRWHKIMRAWRFCEAKTWKSAFVSVINNKALLWMKKMGFKNHSDDLMMMTCQGFFQAQMRKDQRGEKKRDPKGTKAKKQNRTETKKGLFCLLFGKMTLMPCVCVLPAQRSGFIRSCDGRTASNRVWHQQICSGERKCTDVNMFTLIHQSPPTQSHTESHADIHRAIKCMPYYFCPRKKKYIYIYLWRLPFPVNGCEASAASL